MLRLLLLACSCACVSGGLLLRPSAALRSSEGVAAALGDCVRLSSDDAALELTVRASLGGIGQRGDDAPTQPSVLLSGNGSSIARQLRGLYLHPPSSLFSGVARLSFALSGPAVGRESTALSVYFAPVNDAPSVLVGVRRSTRWDRWDVRVLVDDADADALPCSSDGLLTLTLASNASCAFAAAPAPGLRVLESGPALLRLECSARSCNRRPLLLSMTLAEGARDTWFQVSVSADDNGSCGSSREGLVGYAAAVALAEAPVAAPTPTPAATPTLGAPSPAALYIETDPSLSLARTRLRFSHMGAAASLLVLPWPCLVALPLAGALRSGVRFDPTHAAPGPRLLLSGSVAALDRALRHLSFEGALNCSVSLRLAADGPVLAEATVLLPTRALRPTFAAHTYAHTDGTQALPLTGARLRHSSASSLALLSAAGGELALLSGRSAVVPASRAFRVQIEGARAQRESEHELAVRVPWAMELQLVAVARAFPSSARGRLLLRLDCFGTSASAELDATDDMQALAVALGAALASFDNAGETSVTLAADGLRVLFSSSAGPLPLLQLTSQDGLFAASVQRLAASSLQPAVLELQVRAAASAQGEYSVAVLADGRATVQTRALPLLASAAQLSAALSAVETPVGPVLVEAMHSSALGHTLRLSLPAARQGARLAVLWLSGSSSGDAQRCADCLPFDPALASLNLTLVGAPTERIGGSLRIRASSSSLHSSSLSSALPADATSEQLLAALRSLPQVTSARVSERECSAERACRFSFALLSSAPLQLSLEAALSGSGVTATLATLSEGAPGPGRVLLSLAAPSGLRKSATVSPLDSAEQVRAALQELLLDATVSVARADSSDDARLRVRLEVRLQARAEEDSVLGAEGALSLRDGRALPSLSGYSPLAGTTVAVTEEPPTHRRYLLAIEAPVRPETSEVQRIECRTGAHFSLLHGAEGAALLTSRAQTAHIDVLDVDAFLEVSRVRAAHSSLAATLRRLLSTGVTLTTNSTTGSLCPLAASTTFVTDVALDLVAGRSMGDVPMLGLIAPRLGNATLLVSELVRGSTAAASEVQLILTEVPTGSADAVSLTLWYEGRRASLPLLAPDAAIAAAVAALTLADSVAVETSSERGPSYARVRWRVEFAASFGAAALVAVSCEPAAPLTGEDRWEGAPCGAGRATTTRLTGGAAPLAGSFTVRASSGAEGTVRLSSTAHGLGALAAAIPGLAVESWGTSLAEDTLSAFFVLDLAATDEQALELDAAAVRPSDLRCVRSGEELVACALPFEHGDRSFSACAPLFGPDLVCSLTGNLTRDGLFGACVSCAPAARPSVLLAPLASSIQLSGAAADIAADVAGLVYVPGKRPLRADTVTLALLGADLEVLAVAEQRVLFAPRSTRPSLRAPPLLRLFEDAPLFLAADALSLLAPDERSVVLSLAVTHGSIALLNHEGIAFSGLGGDRNVTVAGSARAVSLALGSLLYVPAPNWNSNSVAPPTNAVQSVSVSYPLRLRYEVRLQPSNGSSADAGLYLDIDFECITSNATAPLAALNVSAKSPDSLNNALTSLISQCNSLNLPANKTFAQPSTEILSSEPVQEWSGEWLWVFTVEAPMANGLFPAFACSSSSARVAVSREAAPPAGSFRLGLGEHWSAEVAVGASSDEVAAALLGLPAVQTALVQRRAAGGAATATDEYRVEFPFARPWQPLDPALHSDASGLAFGPVACMAASAMGADVSVSVAVVEEGSAGFDELRISVIDSDRSAVETTVPIYVLPVYDAPFVDTGAGSVEVDEDSAAELHLTLTSHDPPEGRLGLQLLSPHGSVTLAAHGCVSSEAGPHSLHLLCAYDDLAALLSTAVYLPERDFFGPTSIDLALTDEAGAQLSSSRVALQVLPVPDHVLVLAPSQLAVERNSSAPIAGLEVVDPDDIAGTTLFSIVLSSELGEFLIPTLQFVQPEVHIPVAWTRSQVFAFDGLLRDANAILRHLRFLAPDGSVERGEILVRVRRQSSRTEDAVRRVSVSVRAPYTRVSAVPLLVPRAVAELSEDGLWTMGAAVSMDLSEGPRFDVEVVVSCEAGTLGVDGAVGSVVTMLGAAAEVGARLSALTYAPPRHFHGSVGLTVTALKDPRSARPSLSSAALVLRVLPEYDAPLISVDSGYVSAVMAPAAESVAVRAFAVEAVEDELLVVELACSAGRLRIDVASVSEFADRVVLDSAAVRAGARGNWSRVSLVAHSSVLDRVLRLVTYTPRPRYRGPVTLELSLQSTSALLPSDRPHTSRRAVSFSARPASAARLVCSPLVSMREGAAVALDAMCVVDAFADPIEGAAQATVRLTAAHGRFFASGVASSHRLLFAPSADRRSAQLSASLALVGAALGTVDYRSDPLFNGNATVAVSLQVSLSAARIEEQALVVCTVAPVNDPPAISPASARVQVPSNGTLALDFFLMSDADLADTPLGYLDVTASCEVGAVRLGSADYARMGVLVLDDGARSGSVRFYCAEAGANELVRAGLLEYAPRPLLPAHADGVALRVCDNGFTGAGPDEGECALALFTVLVGASAEAPSLRAAGIAYGQEDTVLDIGGSLRIEAGAHSGRSMVTVALHSDSGSLAWSRAGDFSPALSLTAELEVARSALRLVLFKPFQDANLDMTVSVSLSGAGFEDALDLLVFLAPVDDAPVIEALSDSFSIADTGSLQLASLAIQVRSPDDADSLRAEHTLRLSSACGYFAMDAQTLAGGGLRTVGADPHVARVQGMDAAAVLGHRELLLYGSALDLSTGLQSVVFRPLVNASGPCVIAVSVSRTSLSSAAVLETRFFVTGNVTVASRLALRMGRGVSADENSSVLLSAVVTELGDSATAAGDYSLAVALSSAGAAQRLLRSVALAGTCAVDASLTVLGNGSFVLGGTIAAVRACVRRLSIEPVPNFHGTVLVSAVLRGAGGAASSDTSIAYLPVNSAPFVTVLSRALRSDSPSRLGDLVGIGDPDVAFLQAVDSPLYRLYAAQCCFLSVNVSCSGCHFSRGAVSSTSIQTTGTPADIARMLGDVMLTSKGGASPRLWVAVDDRQSYGRGPGFAVEQGIELTVARDGCLPLVALPAALTVAEQRAYSLQELGGGGVQVFSCLPPAAPATLRLRCSAGSLELPARASEVLHVESTGSSLVVSGPSGALSRYLGSVVYASHWESDDVIETTLLTGARTLAQTNSSVLLRAFRHSVALPGAGRFVSGERFELGRFFGRYPGSEARASALDHTRFVGTVGAHAVGALEVQEVTAATLHRSPLRLIDIECPSGGPLEGTLTLGADLAALGAYESTVRLDSRGWSLAEGGSTEDPALSMRSHVRRLLAPLADRLDVRVSSAASAGAVRWTVRIDGAPPGLPALSVLASSIESTAGGPCSCIVSEAEDDSEAGGAFALELGMERTAAIAIDASAEAVAAAVQGLSAVQAVAVTRSGPSADGYSWRVTFFALRNSTVSDVSEMTALTEPSAPFVSVRTVQQGFGTSRVFKIATTSRAVDLVVSIEARLVDTASFFLRLSCGAAGALVGPVFALTVASAADEVAGPYPPHAQPNGRKAGQSLQAMLAATPLFAELASGVSVRASFEDGLSRWSVTFLEPSHEFIAVAAVDSAGRPVAPSLATVTVTQQPNRVAGTSFYLSFCGHRTPLLLHNSTAEDVRLALMGLASVHDPAAGLGLGLGRVEVARRGPDKQGAYSWLVALLEEMDPFAAGALVASVGVAAGLDTNVFAGLLRDVPPSFRAAGLSMGAGRSLGRGTSNAGPCSLLAPCNLVAVAGHSMGAVYEALAGLEYTPPLRWDGETRFLVSVDAGAQQKAHGTEFSVSFTPVRSPPQLLFEGSPMAGATVLSVLEDVESPLSGVAVRAEDAGASALELTLSAARGEVRAGAAPFASSTVLRGNVLALNALLSALVYRTCANCNGMDHLALSVRELSATGPSAEASIRVRITAVNDAPTIRVANASAMLRDGVLGCEAGLATIDQNEHVALGALLTIDDVDFRAANFDSAQSDRASLGAWTLDLCLRVSGGVLRMRSIAAVQVLSGDPVLGSASACLRGGLADLQTALLSLDYAPSSDWWGVDMVEVSLDDRGGIGEGGSKSARTGPTGPTSDGGLGACLLVRVREVPHAPAISPPPSAMLEALEDTAGLIGCPDTDRRGVSLSAQSFLVSDRNVNLRRSRKRVILASNVKEFGLYGSVVSNFTYADPQKYESRVFSVSDHGLDGVEPSFALSLRVTHGRLSLPNLPATASLVHGSGFFDASVTVAGSLREINVALSCIVYNPDLNWNSFGRASLQSQESIRLQVEDDAGLVAVAEVPIVVAPANDAPAVSIGEPSLPHSMLAPLDLATRPGSGGGGVACMKNIACRVPHIFLRDADGPGGSLSLTLAATKGSFFLDPSSNPLYPAFEELIGDNGSLLRISVPSEAGELVVRGVYYRSFADYVGEDTISVTVTDEGSPRLSGSARLLVLVGDVDLAPSIVAPDEVLDVRERSSVAVRGVAFSSNRLTVLLPPARTLLAATPTYANSSAFSRVIESGVLYRVRLTADQGALSLPRVAGLRYLVEASNVLEFVATLGVASAAVSALLYSPPVLSPRTVSELCSITVAIEDLDSHLAAAEKTVRVRVLPRFNAPTIHVPGEVFGHEEARRPDLPYLDFTVPAVIEEDATLSLEQMFVSSDDAAETPLVLRVSALLGRVLSRDSAMAGMLASGGAVEVSGDAAFLNALLLTLVYVPPRDFSGRDSLAARVCSLHEGTELCDAKAFDVLVTAVNDAPLLLLAAAPAVFQDSAVALDALLAVTDVDSPRLVVSVAVDIGTLTLARYPSDFALLNGTGDRDQGLAFSAGTEAMHAVLAGIVFFPPAGWNSYDERSAVTLTVTVEDLGSPSLVAKDALRIVVERGVQRLPLFRLPGAEYTEAPCSSLSRPQSDAARPQRLLCGAIASVPPYPVAQSRESAVVGVELFFDDSASSHSGMYELVVAAEAGSLISRAVKATRLGLSLRWTGGSALATVGTAGQLNALLRDLAYLPPSTFRHSDSVRFAVRSAADFSDRPAWANATLPVAVVRQPFVPLLRVDAENMDVFEDHAAPLRGLRLAFSDADGDDALDADYVERQSAFVSLSFSCGHGYLLLALRGLNLSLSPAASNATAQADALRFRDPFMAEHRWLGAFAVEGTVGQINQALRTALYRPRLNWHSSQGRGVEADVLSFVVAFSDSPLAPRVLDIGVTVHAANDAPVIEARGERYSMTLTDDMLSHTVLGVPNVYTRMNAAAAVLDTRVRDVDCGDDGVVLVSLVGVNGRVSIHNSIGKSAQSLSRPVLPLGLLFVKGTGSLDADMQFRAPIGVVNEALSELTFTPTTNFFGFGAKMVLTVHDLGNGGTGGQKSDSRTWSIVVGQTNRAPSVSVPATTGGSALFQVDEGEFVRLSGAVSEFQAVVPNRDVGFELFVYLEPNSYSANNWGAGRLDFRSRRLFDINPGSESSFPSHFHTYRDALYFRANDGTAGTELWRVEDYGVVAEQPRKFVPFMFADLYPGSVGSDPAHMVTHNELLYFSSSGVDTSWRVALDHRDNCSSLRPSGFDSRVRFAVAESAAWDPTRLYDCPTGFRWASTAEAYGLFPSPVQSASERKTYFDECGWRGFEWGGVARSRFRFSDSAATGAVKSAASTESYRPDVGDFSTDAFAGVVCVVDGYLGVFAATTNNELWRSDGSVERTQRVHDLYSGSLGSYPSALTSFGPYLYFGATTNADGRELWRSLGDSSSPPRLVSFGARTGINPDVADSNPEHLLVKDDLLFFAATDSSIGRELWTVRASDDSVSFVDVLVGIESSHPSDLAACDAYPFVVFAATTAAGRELWTSDGSSASMVSDICPGAGSSSPANIVCFRGLFYFQADDCAHGRELWVSDGLVGGRTAMVRDIRPGSAGSAPAFMTPFRSELDGQDYLLFVATDGLYTNSDRAYEGYGGSQLWRTDGTAEGTDRALMQTENDLYVSREEMQTAFPKAMLAVRGALFIPGSTDTTSTAATAVGGGSKGLKTGDQVYSFSQAVVIADPDTPADKTLTLTISASRGLVLLSQTSVGSFAAQLSFLLADPRTRQRALLTNMLLSRGHLVATASDGDEVLRAVRSPNATFDCLLVFAQLDAAAMDVLGTVRLVRAAASLPVFAYSADATLAATLLEAGATEYLREPLLTGDGDRARFQAFVGKILSFFSPPEADLTVTEVVRPVGAVDATLLPGNVFGRSITLNGTVLALNRAVSSLYYFAPNDTFGSDNVVFTVTDEPHPESCQAALLLSPLYANFSTTKMPVLCDTSTVNTVSATIPVFVASVNHAPEIALAAATFDAVVDADSLVPQVSVSDPDITEEAELLSATNANGVPTYPTLSVLVSATYGVVSLPVVKGLSLTFGQGYLEAVVGFNGRVRDVNDALAALRYQCRATDFCAQLGRDSIGVFVDDNGFSGRGGALSTRKIINVIALGA